MLESVSTLTHLFPQLEEILFPIMHKMCSQDGQDVFEEVLQIISYCTYFCEEVRASFTTFDWAVSLLALPWPSLWPFAKVQVACVKA